VSDLERLLAAKADADRQLAEAETGLLAELVTAKKAYRANRSPANRERKDAAVAAISAYRLVVRVGRTVHDVAGDTVVALEG
jgi:hypothetical protein